MGATLTVQSLCSNQSDNIIRQKRRYKHQFTKPHCTLGATVTEAVRMESLTAAQVGGLTLNGE